MGELIGNVHIVPIIAPVGATGAATYDIVSMQKYNHLTFILQTGVLAGTIAVTVENCTTAAGASNDAMPQFYYREMVTTDTWGALTASGGTFTIADDDDGHIFAIEIDADELTATDHYFVSLVCAAPSTGTDYISAIAILSEPRYMKDVPFTAVA